MTDLSLTALFAVIGVVFGTAYFAALQRTVDAYVSARRRFIPAILTLARVAGAIGFLVFTVHSGALPLLGAFAGILGARTLALGAVRRSG